MDATMLRDLFCTECSLQFNKKIVYDLHLSLVHGKKTNIKQEPNNCEETSEGTETLPESLIKDKPFRCKICDSEFAYQDNLDGHVASVHGGNMPFKCENTILKCVKCDTCFKTNFALKRHMEKVHEGKKHFNCDTCGTKFLTKLNLEGHIAADHEGKKTFNCDNCDAKFAKKDNLNRHIDVVHEGKKRFKCCICYSALLLKLVF